MQQVLLTALGIGGSTVIGALLGFSVKKISHKWNDLILSFAAGVMLAAAIMGLILPGMEYGGRYAALIAGLGILSGALFLNLVDRIVPHLHQLAGINPDDHSGDLNQLNKILLFVMAIAIHNFPEGVAAGVSFGSGDTADAFSVAAGIALQNIPEGMVIIAPMLASGISRSRTFWIALATGLVEVIGTIFGYLAVSVATFLLPFVLCFAGGTMLYVISNDMIPETHSHGYARGATYALLVGFIAMLCMSHFIG